MTELASMSLSENVLATGGVVLQYYLNTNLEDSVTEDYSLTFSDVMGTTLTSLSQSVPTILLGDQFE
ncbi:MAG: hypothetical protein QW815_00330 [Nitrososphaerota archaeon]